jgi:flagellar protein FlaG
MDVTRLNTNYQTPPPPTPTPNVGQGVDGVAQQPVQSVPTEVQTSGNGGFEVVEVVNEVLQQAIDSANAALSGSGREIYIRHHEATNRNVVTVRDTETHEVIREIPPERVLDAHANMLELAGLLVDTRG